MALERTLAIIKPDAVANNYSGKILSMIEEQGLNIIAAKMVHLSGNPQLLNSMPNMKAVLFIHPYLNL